MLGVLSTQIIYGIGILIAAVLAVAVPVIRAKRIQRKAATAEALAEETTVAEETSYADEVVAFQQKYEELQKNYISTSMKTAFLEEFRDLYRKVTTLPKRQQNRYSGFLDIYRNMDQRVEESNRRFVQTERSACRELFQIDAKRTLDAQQQEAVVTDEDHNLVLAGAGSGKTLTITGKVKYLIERKQVPPEEILLLAFTRKAAGEMTERLGKMGIDLRASTFHALGLNIIAGADGKKPEVFLDDGPESDFQTFLVRYFKKTAVKTPKLVRDLVSYLAVYLNIPADMEQFANMGELHEYERHADLETLKSKYIRYLNKGVKAAMMTLQGERVRSIEELIIANFLFLHGVRYEYEKLYPFQEGEYHKVYRPDFYLPDYDIWLEHFGITRDGRAPQYTEIEEKDYLETMAWKRSFHKKNHTKLIETYSWYNSEGILLEKLEETLRGNGVEFQEPDYVDIYKSLEEEPMFTEFRRLCGTFIILYKSNGYGPDDLGKLKYKEKQYQTVYHRARLAVFREIMRPLLKEYEAALEESGKIDFSDMLIQASKRVQEDYMVTPYRYVIVDEYQDISKARAQLLDAILEQTGAHLLCVGDDWQSIYRFSGSDLGIFTGFEARYTGTKILKIEKTYRNSQELLDVTARFVQRNPAQMKKSLRSDEHIRVPVTFCVYEKSVGDAIKTAVDELIGKYGEKQEILFLGRTKYDKELLKGSGLFAISTEKGDTVVQYREQPAVKMKFMTVHKAKGLEADNVVLLNFNNGILGFPNKIADDPLLTTVLSDSDSYLYGEERRLLYVALTRTKKEVYVMTNFYKPSEFKREFADEPNLRTVLIDTDRVKTVPCPRCQTGILLERFNEKEKSRFVGCSNYPGCDFTVNDLTVLDNPVYCKQCGSLMAHRVLRNGKKIYGCTRFPKCENKIWIK